MRAVHALWALAELLLLGLISQTSFAWNSSDPPREESPPPRFELIKTFVPWDLHQSKLDSLSGGLTQRLPYRMAMDSHGRILVTDPMLSVVHVLDLETRKWWQIRGDRQHRMARPAYITVDGEDNIYVSDLLQGVVFVFQPDGRFKRWIGMGSLHVPSGVWVDKQNGRLYVADWVESRIVSFDLEGTPLQAFGGWGREPGQLSHPRDVVVQGDTVIVLDAGNLRFTTFDLQGRFRGVRPFGYDRNPTSFASDATGNLYYFDSISNGLLAVDEKGKLIAGFGQLPYGTTTIRPRFRCIFMEDRGRIFALRPTFEIDLFRLVSDAEE